MVRPNPRLEENIRYVEAVTIFHELYVAAGPYKSHVPRLVSEICERLCSSPEEQTEMKSALLSMFGKRGAAAREKNRSTERLHSQASVSSSPTQLELFDSSK